MTYSEARRHNPAIRAEVERIHKARKAKLEEAATALEAIYNEMIALDNPGGDNIYSRCVISVWNAYNQVSGDAVFIRKIGGDTYTGNMAASQMGANIEKRLGR